MHVAAAAGHAPAQHSPASVKICADTFRGAVARPSDTISEEFPSGFHRSYRFGIVSGAIASDPGGKAAAGRRGGGGRRAEASQECGRTHGSRAFLRPPPRASPPRALKPTRKNTTALAPRLQGVWKYAH